MNPFYHGLSSVKKWGGTPEDYQPIHDWLDAPKQTIADFRHRMVRHHSFGIFECEEKFGRTITNSDGRKVPVRLIAEQHIREDCGGKIPSVQDWVMELNVKEWMTRGYDLEKERFRTAREARDLGKCTADNYRTPTEDEDGVRDVDRPVIVNRRPDW